MEMLLFRVAGLLSKWKILCPPDKRDLLEEYISNIKVEAGKILWLSYK
jgi:hypothetical protein